MELNTHATDEVLEEQTESAHIRRITWRDGFKELVEGGNVRANSLFIILLLGKQHFRDEGVYLYV